MKKMIRSCLPLLLLALAACDNHNGYNGLGGRPRYPPMDRATPDNYQNEQALKGYNTAPVQTLVYDSTNANPVRVANPEQTHVETMHLPPDGTTHTK